MCKLKDLPLSLFNSLFINKDKGNIISSVTDNMLTDLKILQKL